MNFIEKYLQKRKLKQLLSYAMNNSIETLSKKTWRSVCRKYNYHKHRYPVGMSKFALDVLKDMDVIDENMAINIALNAKDWSIRSDVVPLVQNEENLLKLLDSDLNSYDKSEAIKNIKSVEILERIAKDTKQDILIRARIAFRLKDEKIAYKLLNHIFVGGYLINDAYIDLINFLFRISIPCMKYLRSDTRISGHEKHRSVLLHANPYIVFFARQNENVVIARQFEQICSQMYHISSHTTTNAIDLMCENISAQEIIDRIRELKQYD